MRPSINYGPNLDPNDGRALSEFIINGIKDRMIIIKSSGKSLRNYCYISDTLTGIFLALSKGFKYKVYNLAHDKETSVFELAKLISKKTNSKLKILNRNDNHLVWILIELW